MNILIFAGGNSSEREISLISGECVKRALESQHRVKVYDPINGLPGNRTLSLFDAVFLALHGGDGEDGHIQMQLERQGIFHYTGSDPSASELAMHKVRAKSAVGAAGIPVARGGIYTSSLFSPSESGTFSIPANGIMIKPICGGSSVGLLTVRSAKELPAVTDTPLMWEERLIGREYSVGVLGDTALPVVELRPQGGIYDYEHKYQKGATEELCPAPISFEKETFLKQTALLAARTLRLRDYARIDFKEDAEGVPRFLEANTLPGMTEFSIFPLAAKAAGYSFPSLLEEMLRPAVLRKRPQ